jgi:hypothetical protein
MYPTLVKPSALMYGGQITRGRRMIMAPMERLDMIMVWLASGMTFREPAVVFKASITLLKTTWLTPCVSWSNRWLGAFAWPQMSATSNQM